MQHASLFRAPIMSDPAGLDIAVFGVPYDLGSTNRNGARLGPSQIREMSRLIRPINAATGINPFKLCEIADVGDTPVNPLDMMESLESISAFARTLREQNVVSVACGGDHTVSLPLLRGAVSPGQPVGMVHFDAHTDTSDALFGTRYNNGTCFRRAVEEGLIDPKRTVQIGIRAGLYRENEMDFTYGSGIRVITMDEFDSLGRQGVIAEIKKVVGGRATYVTFDIDGLDPVYCLGTGAPEPGGLSMRDAQVILRGLRSVDVIGGDVCEVSPPLDPSGHTALNAANLMFEILCLAAESLDRRRGTPS
jgi:guanidinopropionase